jgi:hypothetical protein
MLLHRSSATSTGFIHLPIATLSNENFLSFALSSGTPTFLVSQSSRTGDACQLMGNKFPAMSFQAMPNAP